MAISAFREHFGLKVISIGLGALIWMVVSGEQVVERSLRVPLEFTNLPAQLEVIGDAPAAVDVRVRGSSGTLGRLLAGELVAIVDLRDARSGRRLFHITGLDVRAPFGIDVVQVTPSTVAMTFEASSSKVVPIVPNVEGEPAQGFTVGVVTAEPSTVEVLGPASVLKTVNEAITEPVSVVGQSAPVTESVTVGVENASARLRSSQRTRVSVAISQALMEWPVSGVPVQAPNAHAQVDIAPAQVTVRVRGPRESTDVKADAFLATVDVSQLPAGRYALPIHVVTPQHIAVVAVEPPEVKVRVR